MSQMERLYWSDNEIRTGHFPNADTLCRKFEVSRRTAFATRDYLKERCGAPLAIDKRRGGWKYTEPDWN